jgi:hypothetical protein
VVELLIPCILQLKNCNGEKMVTIILRKALDVYRGQKEDCSQIIEKVFWAKVLGMEESASH